MNFSRFLEIVTFINMGNCFASSRKSKKVDNINNMNPYASNQMLVAPSKVSIAPVISSSQPLSGITELSRPRSHPLPEPGPSKQTEKTRDGSQRQISPTKENQILSSQNLKSFLYDELRRATQNFHPNNLLGEGGFGLVYKGWLHDQTLNAASPGSGLAVAVKKLKPQGLQGHKEWLCEVDYLGRLHHPNVVKLIGFCLEGENRLLVYEFMPAGSLENHLFKRSAEPLPWATRVKIAVGAARGLCFLHESECQVIYRDFKASNILLDPEFKAKLSDFGLAKPGPTGDQTHVTTTVMGTEGYAAPEYVTTGKLSTKCDVYSFGVVLFELLTGRCAVDYTRAKAEHHLISWVKPHLRDRRTFVRIMDSKLEGQYPRKGAFVAATLALHCINPERKFRPPMSEVLEYLEQLQSPKFMSLPSPPKQKTEEYSPTQGHISPADWSPINRTPRLASPPPLRSPMNHAHAPRRPSPGVPRKSPHRSRFSGYIEPSGNHDE